LSYDFSTDVFTLTSIGCHYLPPLQADQFAFAQNSLCGDGEIITQVVGPPFNPLGWAGVSMRESNAGGSKKVHLLMNSSNFLRREFRMFDNGPSQPQQFPRFNRTWLKLQRNGNQFVMYASLNGVNWQMVGTANVSMNNCIQVGLVVTNGHPNSTVTAQFANTQIIQNAAMEPFTYNDDLVPYEPVQIFPNPASDRIMVHLGHNVSGAGEVQLIDALGKIIYHNNMDMIDGQMIEIPVNQLSQGWYMTRVSGPDGLYHTEKILIQR
jgi:hypothetical protein